MARIRIPVDDLALDRVENVAYRLGVPSLHAQSMAFGLGLLFLETVAESISDFAARFIASRADVRSTGAENEGESVE